MNLFEVISARRAIVSVANKNIDKENNIDKIPVALKYKLVKFLKETEGDEEFFQKQLTELIEQYAERDEEGNPVTNGNEGVKVRVECQEECAKKIKELHNIRTEHAQKFLTLGDIDNLEIGYSDMEGLYPFIKEE